MIPRISPRRIPAINPPPSVPTKAWLNSAKEKEFTTRTLNKRTRNSTQKQIILPLARSAPAGASFARNAINPTDPRSVRRATIRQRRAGRARRGVPRCWQAAPNLWRTHPTLRNVTLTHRNSNPTHRRIVPVRWRKVPLGWRVVPSRWILHPTSRRNVPTPRNAVPAARQGDLGHLAPHPTVTGTSVIVSLPKMSMTFTATT